MFLGCFVSSTFIFKNENHFICFQTLANLVTNRNLDEGRVYPPLSNITSASVSIAVSLAEFMYKEGIATTYPEPQDKEAYIRTFLYNTKYEDLVPSQRDWEEE